MISPNMAGRILTTEQIQQAVHTKRFNRVLNKLKILSSGKGSCLAELKVDEEHTNAAGTIHGGLSITLIDMVSSYALMTHEDKGAVSSVSVDMNIEYLKAAKLGEKILIDAKTVRTKNTLAFLEVLIKNKDTGDVLVKGSHTQYTLKLGT